METFYSLVAPSLRSLRGYSERLLVDVSAQQFARKPSPGQTPIEINHPAFNFGHLALYPGVVTELMGIDDPKIKTPTGWMEMFKMGCPCHDDPGAKIYPAMKVITDTYFEGYDRLAALLPDVSEKHLSIPISGERGTRFPTVGNFLLYILTGHMGTHLGQVSAWRRCMGMKAA